MTRRAGERGSFTGGFTGCFGVLAAVVLVVVVGGALVSRGGSAGNAKPAVSTALPTDAVGLATCENGTSSALAGLGGSVDTFRRLHPAGGIAFDLRCSSANVIAFIDEKLPTPVPAANIKANLLLAEIGLVPADSVVISDVVRKPCELVTYHSPTLAAAAPQSGGNFVMNLGSPVDLTPGADNHYDAEQVNDVILDDTGVSPGSC
jgi:hypothetical protein